MCLTVGMVLHLGADLNLYRILRSGKASGQDLCTYVCVMAGMNLYLWEDLNLYMILHSGEASRQGLHNLHFSLV